jgi:hypothetical protein
VDRAMTLPIEQEEKDTRISPMAFVRRSGLLAVVGGAYLAVLPFVHPESPQSAAWVPVHLGCFAALAVILLGLVGIFASSSAPDGWAWQAFSRRTSARP